MLIADLQFSFGYQIRFRAVSSSGIKSVQKYRVVLGFLKRARAGLRVENHDPVPTLVPFFYHRTVSLIYSYNEFCGSHHLGLPPSSYFKWCAKHNSHSTVDEVAIQNQ